jgi:hypothetical protein
MWTYVGLLFSISQLVGTRVEAGYNSSTVIPASRKRQQKGIPVPGGITGSPCSWGYKYGNLALQVGGVSDETVKYGREFCWISTQESLFWQGPEAIVQ